jgi:hypothetical protein
MTELTDKQKSFCDIKLKTVLNRSTGVRGITYDNFTGYFTVRDTDNSFVDSFTNFDEAMSELLVIVHRFNPPEPEVIDAVISYLGCDKFLR